MIPLWAKLAAAGAVLAALAVYHVVEVERARTAGQLAERAAWQEQRLRDIAKREAERLAAQEAIARVEADYLAKQASQQIAIADLEKALEDEKNDSPAACGPVLSKRLRDSLNAIGR